MKESQEDKILSYLMQGKTITSIEALNKFGCFRLAARISDLGKKGYSINSDLVTKNGKSYAEYSLNEPYNPL